MSVNSKSTDKLEIIMDGINENILSDSKLVEKITNTSLSGLPSVYESPEEDSEASTFKSNIQLNISDS